jgi:hypothetical protein
MNFAQKSGSIQLQGWPNSGNLFVRLARDMNQFIC